MKIIVEVMLVSLLSAFNSYNEKDYGYFRKLDENEIIGHNSRVLLNDSVSYPNDKYYPLQWNLESISLKEVYHLNKSSNSVSVAIIGSGLDKNHSDSPIGINEEKSISFSKYFDAFTSDETAKHSTAISGIIAARTNNYKLLAGISPNVEIISVCVGQYRNGEMVYNNDELVEAINYCTDIGVDIINYSIGGFNSYSERERNAIQDFPGLFVTSAGNDGINIDNEKFYPASYKLDNMIVVGATDRSDEIWEKSNYGKNTVDLFAPGKEILCLDSTNYNIYDELSGTSYAAPHVVGVAASLLSEYDLTISELKNLILSTVNKKTSLENLCLSGGILDASKLIHYKHNYSSTYEYIDTKYHYSYCICDERIKSGHVVAGGSFENGNRYAQCLYCGGLAEMGLVINPLQSANSCNYSFELIDGLYYSVDSLMIDGILNLSFRDYMNFLNKGEKNE